MLRKSYIHATINDIISYISNYIRYYFKNIWMIKEENGNNMRGIIQIDWRF